MSDPNLPDLDSLIRAEVDRSVTPYVGKHPAFMIAKLRELSERYWRENPVAAASLRRKLQKAQLHSATSAIDPQAAENEGEAGEEEG